VNDEALAAKVLFDREPEPGVLAEWTNQTAAPPPARDTGLARVFLARAGLEWAALPASMVEAALPLGPVHAVPYLSSPVFLGLANVEGELLPCVCLAALLGLEPDAAARSPRLVAVATQKGRFVLKVCEAAGIREHDPAAATPPPDTVARSPRSVIAAVIQADGRTAGLADPALLEAALARSLRP
jgi:chemotaxis-related protein WspD